MSDFKSYLICSFNCFQEIKKLSLLQLTSDLVMNDL